MGTADRPLLKAGGGGLAELLPSVATFLLSDKVEKSKSVSLNADLFLRLLNRNPQQSKY